MVPDASGEASAASLDEPDASSTGKAGRRELPLTDFHKGLEECVGKLNGRVKHCGRSAFHHIRRAWVLHGIDNEMSAFRAITAEEEAASALILSLQQKQYPGARGLNFRAHLHKAALTPFFAAVAKVLSLTEFAKPTVRLSPDVDPPRVSFFVDMSRMGMRVPEPLFAEPDEPLNFLIRLDSKDSSSGVHMFEEQLQEVTQGSSLDEIVSYLKAEANLRNELLYASDTGIPAANFTKSFLLERLRRVTVLLTLTVAIQQTPKHQLFAVQCLRAFLRVMPKVKEEPFDFGPAGFVGDGIAISKEPGGEPIAWFVRRYTFQINVGYQLLPVLHVGWNHIEALNGPAEEGAASA
ncbi:hypothetical protein MHZ93_23365 [Roseomonas sp. ACRSG]|nr:hypothetical protein [Roseomonas sp. ACRSG]